MSNIASLQAELDAAHKMLDGDGVQFENHGEEGRLSLAERCECLINNKDSIEDELVDTQNDVAVLNARVSARDHLLIWLLWHHQGGSSPVGQPIRKALGIGTHDRLTDEQLAIAQAFDPNRRAFEVSS